MILEKFLISTGRTYSAKEEEHIKTIESALVDKMRKNLETMLPSFSYKNEEERQSAIETFLTMYGFGINDALSNLDAIEYRIEQGKKEILDRACKCLKANFVELYLHYMRGASEDEIVDEFREYLKKAMEEN